ncbi:hypothetical protein Golob_027687 [Gossypium lobatum]|uniref:Uncharacterized protein n=1 Tax=Gossypium lobatum TaxID=34289 RepID=A0A7J8NHR1_9ROSI|nr:hypothetical protein [Gossypium lobatum]
MDNIIDYLTVEKAEWTHQLDTEFPILFHMLDYSLWPKCGSTLCALVYILSMICYVRKKKIGLVFPHLVIALWKQEKVPMGRPSNNKIDEEDTDEEEDPEEEEDVESKQDFY